MRFLSFYMTESIHLLFFLLISTILISYKATAQECFRNTHQLKCSFGHATPYRFIANYDDTRVNYTGCTEKKIWMMVRHGTRSPKKKHIRALSNHLPDLQNKIIRNFKPGNSGLSANTIENFKKWKLTFQEKDNMILAPEGENELIDLAERTQARFPTLFPEDYNEELFKFKYTARQRTEQSAKSFVLGLFGQHQASNISFLTPEDKDPILRFYKECELWLEYKKKPESLKEKNLFIQSETFKSVLSEISKRVGFRISYDDANFMYIMCSFETAWNESTESPWCDVLSLNDIKVLEFADDLKYYYVHGYGYNLNYEQACPVLKDMFEFFKSSDKSLATVYFSHSGAILKILSLLGIAKDEKPLTHESFLLHEDSRKWKVTLIDSFASNIAFILYDCEKQGPSILVMHQERPANIPGCPEGQPCPIKIMKDKFPETIQECQFNDICSNKNKSPA